MNRRIFAVALSLGLGLAFVPKFGLAEGHHLAEAITHTKEAIEHGKLGHADALVTHAEEALKHAKAAEDVRAAMRTPAFRKQEALRECLRRLKVVDQPAMSMFESKTYSQLLPDGKAWRFHFLQEVKSFITHPSPDMTLGGPGFYEITGLAYSGNGRIARTAEDTIDEE